FAVARNLRKQRADLGIVGVIAGDGDAPAAAAGNLGCRLVNGSRQRRAAGSRGSAGHVNRRARSGQADRGSATDAAARTRDQDHAFSLCPHVLDPRKARTALMTANLLALRRPRASCIWGSGAATRSRWNRLPAGG